MADYTNLTAVKTYLSGSTQMGTDTERDATLSTIITANSRSFDRETGRPIGYWAAQTGVTRRYPGNGQQWLDIDEFNAITAVTMSSNQTRSDALTLPIIPPSASGYTATPNDVELWPLIGPPFNQLFLLRGFLPDAYNIGNIAVTGDVMTPAEITHAVTIWTAYTWKSKEAGWADLASRPDGPGLFYSKGIPPEVVRIIRYYSDPTRAPNVAVIGDDTERLSKWLGWRTAN